MGTPKAHSRNVSELPLRLSVPRLYSRTLCSAVSLPMLTSCNLRVISRGMTHPGLLMALMVAATPKQIAMARQTANSESHIFALRAHDNSF
jgi:hypothetical protein